MYVYILQIKKFSISSKKLKSLRKNIYIQKNYFIKKQVSIIINIIYKIQIKVDLFYLLNFGKKVLVLFLFKIVSVLFSLVLLINIFFRTELLFSSFQLIKPSFFKIKFFI